MKAIILAAGYSTRLYPDTCNKSKCLIDIGGSPIIDRIVSKIFNLKEIEDIFIVTNDKFFASFEMWKSNSPFIRDLSKVHIVNDGTSSNETRLGSLKDLCLIMNDYHIDDDVLVVAGDNLFEPGLEGLIQISKERKASTLGVYDFHDRELVKKRFGIAILDHDNKVVGFQEKPEEPLSSIAATALYVLVKSDLDHIINLNRKPDEKEKNIGEIFIELISRNSQVYAYFFKKWFDIGTHEDLKKARDFFS
jgi:glucose-1-phosphate thymidylyltransferase